MGFKSKSSKGGKKKKKSKGRRSAEWKDTGGWGYEAQSAFSEDRASGAEGRGASDEEDSRAEDGPRRRVVRASQAKDDKKARLTARLMLLNAQRELSAKMDAPLFPAPEKRKKRKKRKAPGEVEGGSVSGPGGGVRKVKMVRKSGAPDSDEETSMADAYKVMIRASRRVDLGGGGNRGEEDDEDDEELPSDDEVARYRRSRAVRGRGAKRGGGSDDDASDADVDMGGVMGGKGNDSDGDDESAAEEEEGQDEDEEDDGDQGEQMRATADLLPRLAEAHRLTGAMDLNYENGGNDTSTARSGWKKEYDAHFSSKLQLQSADAERVLGGQEARIYSAG